ncbi:MAG: alkaline phosphatase PhoX [Asticcacaulis sp.]
MSALSRRRLLSSALAVSTGFSGITQLAHAHRITEGAADTYVNEIAGYGPLVKDPAGLIDLPEGFSYHIFSRQGEEMNDGFLVPGMHDGMACFPYAKNKVALVRNHEIKPTRTGIGPFGPNNERADRLKSGLAYASAPDGTPLHGGTTTLIYDTQKRELVRHHLSLTGTSTNCAGGPTPWGSWLSCEETSDRAGETSDKNHGYVFEVPSKSRRPVKPRPLKAMGRFDHEAVAIDPKTGIAYMTEDTGDSAFYRFIPNDRRRLHKGGRLQALAIRDRPHALTDNRSGDLFWQAGQSFNVDWIDLDEVDSPNNDLRHRAHAKGAAQFARGEGIWFGDGELYFACTSGGVHQNGQLMRYVPGPYEGTAHDATLSGKLQLFAEPNNDLLFDYIDNVTVAPWGHIYACEDRYSDTLKNHIRILTRDGKVATFARNTDVKNSEWAGACFSPDGSTLFANLQANGWTVAITGPWDRFRA